MSHRKCPQEGVAVPFGDCPGWPGDATPALGTFECELEAWMMTLCPACIQKGLCRKRPSLIVAEHELTAAFVQDARNFAYRLTQETGLTAGEWIDYLVNAYRDHPGRIVDHTGREVWLDTDVLERPYPEDADGWFDATDEAEYDHRTWYRDNLMQPCGARPRRDNAHRLIVVLSILRARYPLDAMLWGVRTFH